MSKKFFPSIILLMGMVLVGGSCIRLSVNNGQGTVGQNVPPQEEDETSRWFTFGHGDVFTMKYPPDFLIETSDKLSGGFLGTSIVKMSFPENAFKDETTNFNEAYLVASETNEPDDVAICTSFSDLPNASSSTIQTKTVDGVVFSVQETTDAAAGNIYTSKLYRTVDEDGYCYELALTVHTGNVHNYPEGTVKEFDKSKAFSVLEKIAETFRFYKEGE